MTEQNRKYIMKEISKLLSDTWRIKGLAEQEYGPQHPITKKLGSMHAEERLAAFLLNLAQRLEARGFSANSLVLRMTREDIGTYLGLKLETVSRCFSRLHDDGLLKVRQRQIEILDRPALEALASGPPG